LQRLRTSPLAFGIRDARRCTRTATRGEGSVTFTSTTAMARDSDVLELVERWEGGVAGERVNRRERFAMRTWFWDSVRDLALAAGFSEVRGVSGETAGARGDRIVAVSVR
jgi:hypothetical protein